MFARLVRLDVPPENVESGIAWINSTAMPRAKAQAGFAGGYWMFDRETGKVAVVTMWESQEALAGSAQMAAGLREESARALGTTPVTVEEYEVVAST